MKLGCLAYIIDGIALQPRRVDQCRFSYNAVQVLQAWLAVIGPGKAHKSAGARAGSGRSNDNGLAKK